MKFRVQIDVAFKEEAEAKRIFDAVKKEQSKFSKISDMENISANYHKCYHDENPTKPCEIIEKIEVIDSEKKPIKKLIP